MNDFEALLAELALARSRYEDLRTAGAPFAERIDARSHLDELRVQMGSLRQPSLRVD